MSVISSIKSSQIPMTVAIGVLISCEMLVTNSVLLILHQYHSEREGRM
jgi:hypothetical protein